MFKGLELKEGMFVVLTGMEIKNDNDIFVVDHDYNIEGKYAVCKNEYCLRKVKLNGEISSSKYNIVFLSDRELKKNPNMNIKIITDLKAAKKEVREYLKNRECEEIVATFELAADQEIKHQCIIRFKEGLNFGTFGEKYICQDSLWLVKLRDDNTFYITELGKKGQQLSNSRMFGCTMGLTNKIIEASEVVEKVETKKGDIIEIKEEPKNNSTITEKENNLQLVKEVNENNSNIDKGILKSFNNIIEITNDLQWKIKNIYIEDNNIHANIINKYGVEKIEGLYAGSDFSEEPTKIMYKLLLKEFNLTESNNINHNIEKVEITEQQPQIIKEEVKVENKTVLDYVTIKEDIHTKTGEKMFVVKLNNKVDYETFKAFETEVKTIDGYYSRFKKGFIFKEEPTEKLLTIDVNILANNSQNNNNSEPITVAAVEQKEIEYPEIDINDIETYTVSKELSKRENDNAMFRNNYTDHTKELQKTLQSANDSVIELCNISGCTSYIEYKAKTYLQSFKKKYTAAYISVLTHKANNVSWMVSGRSGLNVRRYNKKQDQLTNKMKYECQLIDEFNERIKQYENKIKREQQQKIKANLQALKNNTDISNIKFKRSKTDNINGIKLDYTCTVYEYNNNFIVSNYWGKFRIYNSNGKELTACNSLEDAKITLIALLDQNQQEQKAI